MLLSTVFSINAHAKENELPKYKVVNTVSTSLVGTGVIDNLYYQFDPTNENQTYMILNDRLTLTSGNNYIIDTSYEFVTDDPPLIAKGGDTVTTMFDAYYGIGLTSVATGGFAYFRGVHSVRMLVTYANGSEKYFDDVTYTLKGNKLTLTCEFTPEQDVKKVKFIVLQNISLVGSPNHVASFYLGEVTENGGYTLSVSQQTEESGLLSGLLEWVKGIKGKIDDTFTSITNGFSNIGKWFAELPSKLWNVISDGLKSLFVPDEDFIVQYKEDMDTMLSEKLGAVYQVIDITLESWDRISASDEQNSINLPQTTINLPENNKFSFGGYDVRIVPDGFDVLANAIKLIGGICVTILFVNGLRRRYDEIMGVEK